MEFRKMLMIPLYAKQKETQMYRTDFWTLWEKARVGCFKRTASKHVYYLGWNRSPAQVGCMRQALGPGALRKPRGSGWRGRWEGGSGWGTHVNPWLFHFNVWQNPLQKKKKNTVAGEDCPSVGVCVILFSLFNWVTCLGEKDHWGEVRFLYQE